MPSRPAPSILIAAAALAALTLAGCGPVGDASNSATTAGPAPLSNPTTMLELMRASVEIPAGGIWAAQGLEAPTDEDWALVDQDALDLASAASLMTLPTTGKPDAAWMANADWHAWAADVQKTALAARDAAKAKNLEALNTAGDHLAEVCQACHDKYRPQVPTDGVARYPFYPARVKKAD